MVFFDVSEKYYKNSKHLRHYLVFSNIRNFLQLKTISLTIKVMLTVMWSVGRAGLGGDTDSLIVKEVWLPVLERNSHHLNNLLADRSVTVAQYTQIMTDAFLRRFSFCLFVSFF